MHRSCEIGQVAEHATMPPNLSQKAAKSFRRGWGWSIQHSGSLVGIHGYAIMTDNVTEQGAARYVQSAFRQV